MGTLIAIVLCVCAYFLYRLVKAVEAKPPSVQREPDEPLPSAEQPGEEQGRDAAFRYAAFREVATRLSKLKNEYSDLVTVDFLDGGHACDCYTGATKEIRDILLQLMIGWPRMIDGKLKELDRDKFKQDGLATVAEAEADVRKNGYSSELIDKYVAAFRLAVERVLKTARVGFNPLLPDSDPSITGALNIAALKAFPHLLEEAYRATWAAHLVLDNGPYWWMDEKKTKDAS